MFVVLTMTTVYTGSNAMTIDVVVRENVPSKF